MIGDGAVFRTKLEHVDRLATTTTGECDAVRLNNTRRLVVDDTNTRSAASASAYRILTAWSVAPS